MSRGGGLGMAVQGPRAPYWKTPKALYDTLDREFCFEFDPCPENPKFDGLSVDWAPYRTFVNPPYGRGIRAWIEKAVREQAEGAMVVMLLPSYTGSPWWHELVIPFATEIRFLRGKLRFNDGDQVAPFWSAVAVFRPKGE